MDYNTRQKKINQRGFTLIEMIVSVSILSLIMGITLAYFGSADQRDILRFSARRLADSLQSAVSFAQSGTLAQYPTAQGYGMHTDHASQQIVLFADQNTANGIGKWDGDMTDAEGKKDAAMRDALTYTIRRPGDVALSKIVITHIQEGTQKDTEASAIDIAALPPAGKIIIGGARGASGAVLALGDVLSITFTLTQTKTGATAGVVAFPLSGRIEVNY